MRPPPVLPCLKISLGPGSRLGHPTMELVAPSSSTLIFFLLRARLPNCRVGCLVTQFWAPQSKQQSYLLPTQAAPEGTGHRWIQVFAVTRVITQTLAPSCFPTGLITWQLKFQWGSWWEAGARTAGLAGPLATGSFSDLEGLVPQAGGHTPHLLQGFNPLFQEPVLSPKPLRGERGRHVRSCLLLLLCTQRSVP